MLWSLTGPKMEPTKYAVRSALSILNMRLSLTPWTHWSSTWVSWGSRILPLILIIAKVKSFRNVNRGPINLNIHDAIMLNLFTICRCAYWMTWRWQGSRPWKCPPVQLSRQDWGVQALHWSQLPQYNLNMNAEMDSLASRDKWNSRHDKVGEIGRTKMLERNTQKWKAD